jgi:hypothetical protein
MAIIDKRHQDMGQYRQGNLSPRPQSTGQRVLGAEKQI